MRIKSFVTLAIVVATFMLLTPAVTDAATLWQVGRPDGAVNPIAGSAEFPATGAYTATFTYTVGTDLDPINAPSMPGYIGTDNVCAFAGGRPCTDTTRHLDIVFDLGCDASAGELFLTYDRYGSEVDTLLLDGTTIATVNASENNFQSFGLALGALAAGTHTLTIEYGGSGSNNGHYIDRIKLDMARSVTDLMAGQHTDAGDVAVDVDEAAGLLHVTYTVDAPWCMTEAHVDVVTDPFLFPSPPAPGQFAQQEEFDPCAATATFDFNLADFPGWESGLWVAAHAVVCQDGGTEIVWADPIHVVTLWAGQHIPAGQVIVTVEDGNLVVTYHSVDGWMLSETHLFVGWELPDKASPGRFPYKHEGLDTDTDVYVIPLDALEAGCGDTLVFMAHAVVRKQIGIDEWQTETGWGEGDDYPYSKNWSMYFEAELSCEEVPVLECETAWGAGCPFFPGNGNWSMYFSYPFCMPCVAVND